MNMPNHDQLAQPDPADIDPDAMDFPALARRVTLDLADLVERTHIVDNDLARLARDHGPEHMAAAAVDGAVVWSPNELLAQLNGIAAVAYRIARCVHPLIEARTRHVDAHADLEGGRR